ncbi:hypothetical protein AB1046_01540 [Promicromonospora sp. Populi]|uniref:hypothetical protein n=1 Tax=Promicromonospora sp. Populi TaxID=3239420 RepID=UPI0034E1FE03
MDFRVSALLSLQRSLWDLVTPNLRGVAATIEHPKILVRFLFENRPTVEDRENVSEAETYTIADFTEGMDIVFTPDWVSMSQPRELAEGEQWIYLRKEE